MYTRERLDTYSPTISASLCQATMSCHSARSCHSPALSLKRSLVARLNFATGTPLGVYLTSGSLPRFPTRITLFTLFGIICLRWSEMRVGFTHTQSCPWNRAREYFAQEKAARGGRS